MTATDLEAIAKKLGGARQRTDGSWMAKCPCHEDGTASLSLTDDGDRLLTHCFAGCDQADVFAAVVWLIDGDRDAFPKGGKIRVPVATYQYPDETGRLQFLVKRYVPKDFRPFRPDGASTMAGVRRVVYNLEAIAAAPGRPLHWYEGEKDADAACRLGLLATTTAGGSAGLGAYDPEHLRTVAAGRAVSVYAHNDPAGEKYARTVAAIVAPAATSVRIVRLPNLPTGGDLSDWLAAGGTKAQLREIVAGTPVWTPDAGFDSDPLKTEVWSERKLAFQTARDLVSTEPYEVRWIVRPWVPHRALVGVDGKPKVGKTHLLFAIIAAVLDGLDFLGEPTERGAVVLLTEQHGASLTAALRRAGLAERDDLHILTWHQATGVPWPAIVEAATACALSVGAHLLVVDTLPQWSGLRGDAENSAGAALEAMEPLQLATARGLAVVMLRHERKGGGDVGESARGSSAFSGAVDVVIALRRPEGNTRPTLRVLEALSRFDETPAELVIEWTPDGYVSHGTEEAVAFNEARAKVLAAAPASEADAVKEADLIEAAGVSRTTGRRAIEEHRDAGRLVRTGKGGKGDPFRYWRRMDSDQTPGERSERNGGRNDGGSDRAGFDADQTTTFRSDRTQTATDVPEGSGVYVCAGCGLPRSLEARPCPNCGETNGIER